MGVHAKHQATMLGHAVCTKCLDEKPVDEFPIRKARKSGHGSWCKPCLNSYTHMKKDEEGRSNWWVKKGRSHWMIARSCTVCGEFNMIDQMDDGSCCKKCASAKHKKYREENAESCLQAQLRWGRESPKATNSERSRAKRMTKNGVYLVTGSDQEKIRLNPCAHCGTTAKPRTIDHVVPVARGGRHAIGNLQALCQSCNSRKSCRLEIEVRAGIPMWKVNEKLRRKETAKI